MHWQLWWTHARTRADLRLPRATARHAAPGSAAGESRAPVARVAGDDRRAAGTRPPRVLRRHATPRPEPPQQSRPGDGKRFRRPGPARVRRRLADVSRTVWWFQDARAPRRSVD